VFDCLNSVALVQADHRPCPKCGTAFTPKRTNQKYCGRSCQSNASRGPRSGEYSYELAERNRKHYERAGWLCHDIYRLPFDQRLQFMADLIEAAREGDGELRGILTDPKLLGAEPCFGIGKLGDDKRNGAMKNIAKAADAYCRRFWGTGVANVVHKRATVPPTGEGNDVEGFAPVKRTIRTRTNKGGPRVKPEGWDYRQLLGHHLQTDTDPQSAPALI
jgi:ribosomal protein S27AE